MAFQIDLRKPTGKEGECNRQWAEAVARLPLFGFQKVSPELLGELANEAAPHAGLTPEEYIRREIGVIVTCEMDDLWINVGFWSAVATLELPNFPPCGIDAALGRIAPVLRTLREFGFVLLNPETNEPIEDEEAAALVRAYQARQALVQRVAGLCDGKPG
ncbi:MAG: hypothetical protein QM784_17510 [Polyangiaceae bacterium]